MPRYYFHVATPRDSLRDRHGEEFSGREEVRDHAAEILLGLARDEMPMGGDGDFAVEVSDAAGAPVYGARLLFRSRWGPGR